MADFNTLFLSPQWLKEYHTKYPHGLSVMENLIEWVNQVNELIDYVNVTPDKVQEILSSWNNDGTLNYIINEVLQTEIELKKPVYDLNPSIVAHRNLGMTYPENTLFGLKKCVENKIDVEFDVRWTSDNVPVVIHDDTVDRTTNGSGNVSELTLSQIKELDAGSWFSTAYAGLSVPTFEEYINAAQGLNLYIDIKQPPTIENLKYLVEILINKGFEYKAHIQIAPDINFSTNLAAIRSISKNISVLASIFQQQQFDDISPYLLNDNRLGVSMNKSLANVSNLKYLRDNKLFVIIATLENAVEKNNYLDIGYTTLMSDYYMEV